MQVLCCVCWVVVMQSCVLGSCHAGLVTVDVAHLVEVRLLHPPRWVARHRHLRCPPHEGGEGEGKGMGEGLLEEGRALVVRAAGRRPHLLHSARPRRNDGLAREPGAECPCVGEVAQKPYCDGGRVEEAAEAPGQGGRGIGLCLGPRHDEEEAEEDEATVLGRRRPELIVHRRRLRPRERDVGGVGGPVSARGASGDGEVKLKDDDLEDGCEVEEAVVGAGGGWVTAWVLGSATITARRGEV
jgi:hypothetical protein